MLLYNIVNVILRCSKAVAAETRIRTDCLIPVLGYGLRASISEVGDDRLADIGLPLVNPKHYNP